MYNLLMGHSFVGMFIQVVPVTMLVGVVYVPLRLCYMKRRGRELTWGLEVIRLVFVCYLAGLINLILVPNNLWTAIWFYLFNGYSGTTVGPMFEFTYNWVPSLYQCLIGERILGSWVTEMLVGNVLMFVPMGVLLPMISKRVQGYKMLLLAVGIPAVVELVQPIMGRSFDIDDVLTNFVGILIGYVIAAAIRTCAIKYRKQ